MQSSRKIGILLLLLAIPIFLVLFLQFFSTSHYDIPVYYENGIDSLTQCESSTEVHRVAPFQASDVITGENQTINFENQIRVVYWHSDDCQDTCRLVLEELARLQGVFESQTALQLLFVSESPLQDAPTLANTYRKQLPEWLFLQGTEGQSSSFVQCELILPQPELPLNATLMLVDDEARIRGYYLGTSSKDVDRLIGEIRILLYNMNTN